MDNLKWFLVELEREGVLTNEIIQATSFEEALDKAQGV